MLSNLLAIMAITIYNQMYGASAVLELITRYNKIATDAMQVGGFAAMVSTVKGLAVGITVLLYLIDLAGKVTEKNFSIEQFFKATLRFVVSYFFILYSDVITNYLIEAGTGITIDTVKDSGFAFFTDDPDNKTLLINGIKDMKAIETLGFVISSVIPWLFSMIGEVILQIVLISRILELVVMVTFAPLSISDIYREGTASPGVQYMKRVLALSLAIMLQLVVVTIICQVYPMILTTINTGYFVDQGDSTLKVDGSSVSIEDNYAAAMIKNNKAVLYPINNFEYTDHKASIVEVVWEGANDIKSALKAVGAVVKGDDVKIDSENKKEKLKDSEKYKLVGADGIIKNTGRDIGAVKNEAKDKAKEILKNKKYRMTIESTERFFKWCIGADGGKMVLFVILLITKVLMIHSSAKLCSYITNTNI